MPTPKLFKSSSSRSSTTSARSLSASVPATDKEVVRKSTITSDTGTQGSSDDLKGLSAAAPREQETEKLLSRLASNVQSTLIPLPGQQIVTMKPSMDTPQIVEAIQKGVNTFMETVPPLMKTLDEVAKVYPFISATVVAFRAAYTLEKKRRENDKRVLAIYNEMKDMMSILVRLNSVSDPGQIAPDCLTIEERMQKLCEAAAEDIKHCANVCDTYLKKKVLTKVLTAPTWEGKLLRFVGVFAKRREEFELALATSHTTIDADAADLQLDNENERTAELTRRMDIMLQLFQDYATPRERELVAMVKKLGGSGVLENEQAMEELAAYALAGAHAGPESRQAPQGRPFGFVELQQEIKCDPEEAIEKNAEFFNRKFDIQRRQIVEDIARAVNREGDRIISVVTAGPHDRIFDPDIYKIWREMGWRGSVKSRHFIMALKDYYVEKAVEDSGLLIGEDSWAVKYINIGRARTIMEAFDDDASGFITVNEVNNFTRSRPLDWSLPHWIAYWAIGWQMTCTTYCVKIEEIFDAMIRLAYEVLPENRRGVNLYIASTWHMITVFVQSIKREKGTEDLRTKFESHVTAEEARLRRNFEDLNYRIDDSDTLRVIAGEGRIEMTLFPMFYLALKRDLEKISLARKHVLTDHETYESLVTILSIAGAALDRINSLRSIFEQQSLEVKDQFEIFAKGLYKISSVNELVFDGNKLRGLPDPIPCRNEIIPDPDSVPLSILNHPLGKAHEINFAAYDTPDPTLQPVEGTHPMLGVYYGFIYHYRQPADPMLKLTLTAGEGDREFVATGRHYRGSRYRSYTLTGNWGASSEGGKIPVEFKFTYSTKDWANTELKGAYDCDENSIRGTMVMPNCQRSGVFIFKRHPDFVRFYPAPSVINARRRWEFAITSVLDRVRREAWSARYIVKRLKDRKRWMELTIREYYGRNLTRDEGKELYALFPGLYEADAQFYASLISIHLSKTNIFNLIECDKCDSIPGGSRIVCIDPDCRNETTTVDLCSEPECINSTITFEEADRKKHLPNHGMFKVHRMIFDRDTARIESLAKDALDSVRGTISQLKKDQKPMPECTRCKATVSLPCWCCVECTGERFICDDCEHKQLAFDGTHTKMHTIVRVSEKGDKKVFSMEERMRLVEDELAKVRETLAKLVEKSTQGSQSEPLTKGDLRAAAIGLSEPTQSEVVSEMTESA